MPSPPPDRLKLWSVIAIGATLTATIWLGVIEVGNARMNGLLQSLPRWSAQPWAYRYFEREDYARDIQVTSPGLSEEQINQQFAQELGRNHLYRLVLGFGTTAVVLSLLGIAASLAVVTQCRRVVDPRLRIGIGVCGAICLGVFIRCLVLGILTHGIVTALVN